MRVALWTPLAGSRIPGGHRMQFEKTLEALRALGVDASAAFGEDADVSEFDVIHAYGVEPDAMRRARGEGAALVMSPIYWGRDYALNCDGPWSGPARLAYRARTGVSVLAGAVRGRLAQACETAIARQSRLRALYELADVLMPNSRAEARAIREELGVTTPMHVVPNAVDEEIFTVEGDAVGAGRRCGVLLVGRFEPHKNQYGLIEAMRGTGVPVTVAGPAHPDHPGYLERCRRRAGRDVTILGGMDPSALPALYRSHKVHALPSWFETTGLVSLEAARCGCNVVTTSRGFAGDYFGDMAWYCDPADKRSIRDAVLAAIEAPQPAGLLEHIGRNFTWRRAAEESIKAYRMAMRSIRGGTSETVGAGA